MYSLQINMSQRLLMREIPPWLRESRKLVTSAQLSQMRRKQAGLVFDSLRECKEVISAVSNGTNKIMFIFILFTAFNYRGRWVFR